MTTIPPGSLPEQVRRYREFALAPQHATAAAIRLTQVGEMTLKPGARPRSFTATERLVTDRVAFSWRARFRMLGALAVHVTDRYDRGEGLLEVRLLGRPMQRRFGPEIARGEAFRYLAEIAWVPQAITRNAELEWRQLGEKRVQLATRIADRRIAVSLLFDDADRIVQVRAERPRAEAGNAATPWVGLYSDYQDFDGVGIPSRGEVRWELPEGPFTYWRGTVTSVEQDTLA